MRFNRITVKPNQYDAADYTVLTWPDEEDRILIIFGVIDENSFLH
jgi:hypothetical protein